MMNQLSTTKNMRGIGILEVLIALVVVSIGVLGLAGTQLNVMRVAKGSNNRSQAVLYAQTIIEQMRANPAAVAGMTYEGLDSTALDCSALPNPYCNAYPSGPTTTPVCSTQIEKTQNSFYSVACGQWDGADAVNGIADNLPNGAITVQCDDAPCTDTSSYTISVTWSETEVADGADVEATKQVTMRVLP